MGPCDKIAVLILSWSMLLCSCRQPANPANVDRLDKYVRQYLFLCIALGERDPDSLDFYFGPSHWVSSAHSHPPSLGLLGRRAYDLVAEISSLQLLRSDDCHRRDYLLRQLRAIITRVELLSGKKIGFREEVASAFGVVSIDSPERNKEDSIRSKLALLLGGSKKLAERYEAFDAKFLIRPDRVPAVMHRALEACQTVTERNLRLPRAQGISVKFVHDRPWSGYSYYLGQYKSRIEINTDYRLTVDRALQLACHESYPGHHVITTLQDSELVRKRQWFEMTVQPTFSPQSFASEALASYAAELAFPPSERLRLERDDLFPLAGLKADEAGKYLQVEHLVDQLHTAELRVASQYLDGQLEFVRAGWALEAQSLMTHTDATLKYLNEYRSYVVTYTLGRDLAARYIDPDPLSGRTEDQRWRSFQSLITNPGPLWNSPS